MILQKIPKPFEILKKRISEGFLISALSQNNQNVLFAYQKMAIKLFVTFLLFDKLK